MFQNILRSLSGSFADLGRWEPTADRSEGALRNGIEKSILFVLCSSAIMGISALTLVSVNLLFIGEHPFSFGS